MRVQHRLFKSSFKSWDTLCEEAAAFATTIGRERLINISVTREKPVARARFSSGTGNRYRWRVVALGGLGGRIPMTPDERKLERVEDKNLVTWECQKFRV